jgi:hypothetical protein
MSHHVEIIRKTYAASNGERIKEQLHFCKPSLSPSFILSSNETKAYNSLLTVLPTNLVCLPKVSLFDILMLSNDLDEFQKQKLTGKVQTMQVDFLICDNLSHILFAIQIDHTSSVSKKRDAFIDSVFAGSSIPLIHLEARDEYAPILLGELITKGLTEYKKLHFPQESMVS